MVDREATLTVETAEGRKELECLPISQPSRILGVWMAPDGNSKEQVRQLRKVTEEWADRVRSGHIMKADAWHYYQTTVKKSLEYPLVATTLSMKQCRYIEAPASTQAPKSSGLLSNTSKPVLQGNADHLGLGDGSLYGTQGRKHVCALVNHGKSNSITGHHIRDLIEGHKLEIGCGGSLFANNYPLLARCLTPTWITNTWEFLWRNSLVLEETTESLRTRR